MRVSGDIAAAPTAGAAAHELRGTAFAVTANLIWGLSNLYYAAVAKFAGPVELTAHRVMWSLCFVLLTLSALRSMRSVAAAFRPRQAISLLIASAICIGTSWTTYVISVATHNIVDMSVGLFMVPLGTVALGVALLHERLRPIQWVALGLGAGAIVVLVTGYGHLPWIALFAIASIAPYSYLKKKQAAAGINSVTGIGVEMILLTPVAAITLSILAMRGDHSLAHNPVGHLLLLMGTGALSALPIILLAMAAGRIPLTTLGFVQYLNPTMTFLIAVFVLDESMPMFRWIAALLIWLALVLLSYDSIRRSVMRRAPIPEIT